MQEPKAFTVFIAGGGTGGHLYPGIALAEEFQKRWSAEIVFFGTHYGIENKVLPKYPFQFKRIWIRGLRRQLTFSNLLFPVRLVVSCIQCLFWILLKRPRVIVGTGGYVSGPVLLAGVITGTPTVIQEQNSYPGLVNRLLGNHVKQVHISYEDSRKYFKKQAELFLSGNPLRGEFNRLAQNTAVSKLGLDVKKKTLLVFGGSQGAHRLNSTLRDSLDALLTQSELQIIWATGPNDYDEAAAWIQQQEQHKDRIYLQPYIDDMALVYAAADLVLCRSGASTLSELAICGLPAVLVPYPYSAAGHQEHNANAVAATGAAITILEKDLSPERLVKTTVSLCKDEDRLRAMSIAAKQLAKPNAVYTIASHIEPLIGSSS